MTPGGGKCPRGEMLDEYPAPLDRVCRRATREPCWKLTTMGAASERMWMLRRDRRQKGLDHAE